MLDKRINILLEKEKYLRLIQLARVEGVSISEIIRRAVSKLYFSESKSRKQAVAKVKEIRKTLSKPLTVSEIKEYINYGRR